MSHLIDMSQREVVEKILLEEGSIDNFRCIDQRITLRLSDIILKLRREGWEFSPESGFIPGTKNWSYILKSAPKPKQMTL